MEWFQVKLQWTFEDICGGKFWDHNLTWNSEYPDFTPCFHDSILVWLPCVFLWIWLPWYFYFYGNFERKPFTWNKLCGSKMVLAILLMFTSGCEAITAWSQFTSAHHVAGSAIYFLSSAIRTMTMLVVIAMIQLDRRKSVYSNGGLWTFWFIDTITTMVTAYSYILRAYIRPDGSLRGEFHVTDVFRFSASLGHFVMVSVSLLLSCFPDMPDDYVPNEKTFPQLHASFPSHLIYHWHSKFLKKGSMKPLETEDLWLLRPCDQVNNYTPGFQKVWREKVEQYHRDRKVSEETESANKSLSSSQCDGQENGSLKHRKVAKDISTSQDKPKSNDNSHDEDTENQSKDDNKRPSFLLLALIQYLGIEHLFGWILFSIGEALELCFPVVLGLLIDFFGSEDEHFWKGYLYSFLFLLLVVGSVTFQQQFFWIFSYMSTRMRGLLISTLYRKALTLSSRARKQHSAGELVNLMSEDVGRLRYMYLLAVITVNIPFTVALALYMLWQLVGVSVLAGLVLILINIPLNGLMESKYNKRMHKKMCDLRDQRMKIVNDVLNGIKVLKLYAWEKSFEKKINDVRDEEMTMMMKQTCLQACHSFIVLLIPFLVLLSIFATYIMIDERNSLDAKTAFMAVSYIEMLRGGLVAAPGRLNYFTECWVSLKRIEKYLCLEEIDPDNVIKNPDALHPLTVTNGEFSWDREQKPTLKNINFTAQEGSLVAVVGQVGAGKSSLLSAMLGEMEKISGTVTVKSSVAYSSQQAWIQNATIENNILFGSQREEKRYQKIIEACALKPDLDILIDGDQCEIGEKGINLSGGQKQRVGLARAIYSSADIYLLDDPLSAVDAHVGKQIFDKVIGKKGLLKKKTRILVTQGVQWLPYVDRIYVMEDGRISETGTYQELLSHDGAFAQYLKTHAKEEVVIESEEEDVLSYSHTSLSLSWGRSAAAGFDHKKRAMRKMEKDDNRYVSQLSGDPLVMEELDLSSDDTDYEELFSEITPRIARKSSASDKKPKKLIEDESTEVGSFRWSIMATYLKAMGIRVSIAILLMVILAQSFEPLSELWLSKWTGDPLITNSSLRNSSDYKNLQNYYITTYAALGLCQSTASVIFHLSFVFMSVGAARKMHDGMLRRILQAPMSFFDSTPTGRILNRFSNDIPAVDNMKNDMKEFMRCILFCCSTLFMLVYTTPTLTLTIIPIGYVYYSLKESFVPTQQQLRKLDSNTNSPIYSHFSETLNGTSTIRAFSRQDQFIADSDVILDRNQTVNFAFECGWRWISTRVENLCGVVTCVAALLSLHNGRSSVALGALAIMSGWKTGRCFHWLMFNMWHFNLRLVSVERVKEYSEINTEADWSVESTKPLADWPTAGAIDIENFSVRYREGLNLVLKEMNCHINPKEKVGIVGRTGAGKSSLTMSLFRILEAAGGTIKIDGVDISSLGLHDLRSKLTILPQDPVLFAGTLRSNLDPFECYTTEQIWTALEHCHLKTFVEQLPDKLLYECGEGGENLSVGQRQLICLGRSLLKKTKVLVLDEATAAVDLETDDLIQKTIRSEFAECTVLTIAHRLKTIIDYDKVMVLDKGEIKEFDSPENLLNAPDSIFYGLAKDAGLVS